jgi:Protein of unknown function (DUF4232)
MFMQAPRDAIRQRQMGVMVGSSFGLHALLRSRLITLFAIVGLAAGCVASSPSASSLGVGTPPAPAGSSLPATPTSWPALEIVPWVDRPAPAFVDPTPRPYPTDARPCRPADLSVRVGDIGAGLGNTNLPVELVNSSGSTCLLNGYPTIGGLSSDGTLTPLPASHGSYFGDPGPAANIGPGEVAALNISGADACPAAQNGEHRSYPTLRIGLPGGGSMDVRAGEFDTVCGVSVSRFGVPADEVPVPVPSPSPLTARISAPTTVTPGQSLEYTVTLTNPSGTDYPLSPCPAYTEFVGSGDATIWVATVRDYYLNCDGTPAIPPGSSVTFEMHLQLPADQPAGMAKFGWGMQGGGGPYANAQLDVQASGG